MVDLDKIILMEEENLARLKRDHDFVFGVIPETPEEYEVLKRSYDSIGKENIDLIRTYMGFITNPSVEIEKKEFYITHIPQILKVMEDEGKDTEYLWISYNMALKYGCNKDE